MALELKQTETFQQRGGALVVLLCGGDKGGQARDIAKAKRLAREWSEQSG